ncbi:MAG TPA: iron transporter, partial [Pseudomonas sp.]|nr:iron transporter [Pseudomonas sp.]
GLFTNSIKALHEAGLWNALQQVVFDWSHLLPADGPIGTVLSGMFGYQDTPTVSTLGAYLLFLAVTLPLFFRTPAPPQRPVAATSNASLERPS